MKHSPAGYRAGRVCPGAADLARALIIDAVGAAALCEGCNGSRMLVLDPKWNGDPDHEPSRPYQPAQDARLPPERVAECVCGDGIRQLPYRDFGVRGGGQLARRHLVDGPRGHLRRN